MQATTSTQTWFGSDSLPLAGWLHAPESGLVRGGVVICPSLGAELVAAYFALRQLALNLASRGFAVLRFDYAGTGDSAGDLADAADVERAQSSIRTAVDYLQTSGVGRITAVGLRIGATMLAEEIANGLSVSRAVFWDPASNGGRFLREASARYRITTGDTPTGDAVHSAGFAYPAAAADALRGCTLPSAEQLPAGLPILMALRPDRRTPPVVQLAKGMSAEIVDSADLERVLDVSTTDRELPTASLAAIADWIEAGSEDVAPFTPPAGRLVANPEPGVVEEFCRLTPLQLAAVVTRSDGPSTSPVIALLNTAAEHHIGPGRMWVDLARSWAKSGRTVVRLDLAGIGDSPGHPDAPRERSYSPHHLKDLTGIAAAISPDDPAAVIPIGLCSGAYHALEWGLRLHAVGAVAINPVLSLALDEIDDSDPDVTRPIAQVVRGTLRDVRDNPRLAGLKARLPSVGWVMLDRLGLHRSPTAGLELVVAGGTDVLLIAGVHDAYAYIHRGGGALRRMGRTKRFRMEQLEGIDHSLQLESARLAVSKLLTDYVNAWPSQAQATAGSDDVQIDVSSVDGVRYG